MKTTHSRAKHIKIREDELRAIAEMLNNEEGEPSKDNNVHYHYELEYLALGAELASYCYTIRAEGSKLLVHC